MVTYNKKWGRAEKDKFNKEQREYRHKNIERLRKYNREAMRRFRAKRKKEGGGSSA